jgi:hypothetical protein
VARGMTSMKESGMPRPNDEWMDACDVARQIAVVQLVQTWSSGVFVAGCTEWINFLGTCHFYIEELRNEKYYWSRHPRHSPQQKLELVPIGTAV